MVTWLPNALSISRVILGFSVLFLYDVSDSAKMKIAFVLIVLAEATDHIDGRLARRLGVASERGYILDGLGDRALYFALILVIFGEHKPNILFVWLLIFGQILVYALRLLQGNWKGKNARVRGFHLAHWGGIRLWVLGYLIKDAAKVWDCPFPISPAVFGGIQNIIAIATMATLYYAISVSIQQAIVPQRT